MGRWWRRFSFLPSDYVQPWIKRGNLVAVRSDPPLPALNYCFLHRADNNRSVVQVMQRYVLEEADFSHPIDMLG